MTNDQEHQPEQQQSEEFVKFKSAMMKIVSAKKPDLVQDYPKMFRDRKPPTAKKSARKKTNPSVPPPNPSTD